MRKLYKTIILLILSVLWLNNAWAQIKNVTKNTDSYDTITAVGFTDYPPVGYIEKIKYENTKNAFSEKYRTVFEDIMKEFSDATEKEIKYIFNTEDSYDNLIRKVRGGKYDLVLGIYHETKVYDGLDVIFPSLINNPISIILLPQNANKVKNLNQLKTMKGAISKREKLSDYVTLQLKDYNLEYMDEPEKMFEKLYAGEIDYVFASYFFGIVETSKLGLRDRLSFSKQVIWNMPLFLGVSKTSPNRNYLVGKLTSYSEKPDSKTKLETKLRQMIMDVEISNRGILPPAYSTD